MTTPTINGSHVGWEGGAPFQPATAPCCFGTDGGGLAKSLCIPNGPTVSMGGGIINPGTINLGSTGATRRLIVNQATSTLSGGGKIILTPNAGNQILATNASCLLTNQNSTISGAGNLGTGQMTLVNQGIISSNLVINIGLMESTNSGGLRIENTAVDNNGERHRPRRSWRLRPGHRPGWHANNEQRRRDPDHRRQRRARWHHLRHVEQPGPGEG